ncbi:MAG: hypothetical protein EHM79_20310 [Geobacter sp.]|nr:MAG: hypothetical protein EHM79_20310 [Geobacter sp.]
MEEIAILLDNKWLEENVRSWIMRSFHFILLLIVLLVFMVVIEEVCSFTVIRPKPSMLKTKTLPPKSSGVPSATTTIPATKPSPGNTFTSPGGGHAPSPTVSTNRPIPSITPSSPPTESEQNKFPVFLFTLSIILVLVVIFWYLTRNVNFKRIFKQYFS